MTGDRLIVEEMLEQIKNDEYGPGTIDFNKITPMPESLNIESSSRTQNALKTYQGFIAAYTSTGIDRADLLNIPKESEDTFLQTRPDINPDDWELGRTAFQNKLQYGASDWYDWRYGNWGTKWNAYGYESGMDYRENDHLSFLTAWSAPHPVIRRLSEMYPDVEFAHEWADEDIGQNCGKFTYKNGVRTMEYYPDAEKDRIEFAAKVMDSSPEDWNLYLNASGNDYLYLGEDDYELVSLFGKPALFSSSRVTNNDIPHGLNCYDLRLFNNSESFSAIESMVTVNYGGSIITAEPLPLGEEKMILLTEDTSPNFLGEQLNLGQFLRCEYEFIDEGQNLGSMNL